MVFKKTFHMRFLKQINFSIKVFVIQQRKIQLRSCNDNVLYPSSLKIIVTVELNLVNYIIQEHLLECCFRGITVVFP